MLQTDSHAHVFSRDLPQAAGRRYSPGYDAPLARYLAHLDAHGIARGVLVQPSFLGTDNSFLLAALRACPQRLRGIAVVATETPPEELAEMDAAGIVGLRLNLVGQAALPDFDAPAVQALLRHAADLGWQVEIHRDARDLPRLLPPLLRSGVKIVVDHFGRPDPRQGVDDPGFRYLLGTGATRRVWVKLSGAYRNGEPAQGGPLAQSAASLLLASHGADRLVWGSDWPHTQHEGHVRYGAARAGLDLWIPDASVREEILTASAAALFRF